MYLRCQNIQTTFFSRVKYSEFLKNSPSDTSLGGIEGMVIVNSIVQTAVKVKWCQGGPIWLGEKILSKIF